MGYRAIDADIANFIDEQIEASLVFQTDLLRAYLIDKGYPLEEVVAAIVEWQQGRLWQLDPAWETFSLSASGEMAVSELRIHVD